ncbi:putative protein kinase RLK-Pelle-CR4L family [Helianthus annuus]|nr:putative protein kinase RLK-Pelle-CR4L family [Helianthus annuus]
MAFSFDKSSAPSQACRRFKVSEIQKATHNFDESLMIGEGGFFQVYKGKISNGAGVVDIPVAINRLTQNSKVGQPEDLLEVENQVLFTLRHRNLVSLFGFCRQAMKPVFKTPFLDPEDTNKNDTILVYDYISNGTLKAHLHDLVPLFPGTSD